METIKEENKLESLDLEKEINKLFDEKDSLNSLSLDAKKTIDLVLKELNDGKIRVANKNQSGNWIVSEWIKKAILLSFKLNDNKLVSGASENSFWFDKVSNRFKNFSSKDFKDSKIRTVPGSYARYGSFIDEGVILLPSFINVGAYVGKSTMIDTWATVGSCAQVGANCHISGGVGIGGVLEPLQSSPVIIEDNCFIGARSEIAEGVIVREGSVISMGVYLGASTRIYDRATKKIHYGEVPPYSVVVSGSMPTENNQEYLYCAMIVKTVDDKTRSKTSINELLRF
jgi:2,3,4,5-tetrahydropyridine-2-carboxylate N-succinyltransferase